MSKLSLTPQLTSVFDSIHDSIHNFIPAKPLIEPLSATPIFDTLRTLENQYTNYFFSPGGSDHMVWLMEPSIWANLQREMFAASPYNYKNPNPLCWSVVTVPTMTGVSLYDDKGGVSFTSSGKIDGYVEWLALIKQGARAVA